MSSNREESFGRIQEILVKDLVRLHGNSDIMYQVLFKNTNGDSIGSRNLSVQELSVLGMDNTLDISGENSKKPRIVKSQDLFPMINQVRGLLNIIPIDIDPKGDEDRDLVKKRFESTLSRLKGEGYKGIVAVNTGSKGYHIAVQFNGLDKLSKVDRESVKNYFIAKYGGEAGKGNDNAPICLDVVFYEGDLRINHWKTGKPVQLIEKIDGSNFADSLLEEYLIQRREKEKEERKEVLLPLLEEEDSPNRYLDLGHIDDFWYFGFNMKGREAIITSNSDILRNTYQKIKGEEFGENEIKKLFDYEGYIGEIAPTILRETVKKFYTKTQGCSLINPKEIYCEVRDKILYYMDFSNVDEIADVLTCWIISTYCYPLFFWFPHLLINAPSESGKTKCGNIITQMSFRGYDIGASAGVTPPQIFRTLEGNRGTMLLDEFERAKGMNASDSQQLVNQLLNASATRDAYVIRVEKIDGRWVAKKFQIFCPKITCNITGINPTSLSRYIPLTWLKTTSEKGKRKPNKEKDKLSFKPIREDLYLLILENWKRIKIIYDDLELPNLANRGEDNWLPLYAVAKFIDSCEGESVNAESQLDSFVKQYKEINIDTGDCTEEFFRVLHEKVNDESEYYTPKEIGDWSEVQEILSFLKSPAHWVGKKLNAYKFQNNRGGGKKKYLLSKDLVKNIIDLYFESNVITPNTTNTTKQHKQHIITPNNDENVGLGGGSVISSECNVEEIDFSKSGIKEEVIKDE